MPDERDAGAVCGSSRPTHREFPGWGRSVHTMQRLDHPHSRAGSSHARRRAGVVAGIAALGLSISACSSGSNSADAASDTTANATADTPADTTVDTTADTAGPTGGTVTDAAPAPDGALPEAPGQPGFGGPGVSGEVTAVDGSTLTTDQVAQDGTITEMNVETTDATTVTEVVTGSLDDLSVGDEIVVNGGSDGDVATSIAEAGEGGMVFRGGPGGLPPDGQLPDGVEPPTDGQFPDGGQPPVGSGGPGAPGGPGDLGGAMTFGTITEIGDGSLTIENADGESVVITTDDSTEVRMSEDRAVGDIEVGDTIRARADDASDSGDTTITADSITLQPSS